MFKSTALATAAAVFGVSATAQAGWHDYRDDGVEYAEVIATQPIYRDVRIEQPREECRQERVAYDDGGYRGGGNEGIGTLLGAVVGGVVGNRFGHGGGRVATTAVGAVIGASAGASLGRNSGGGYYSEPSYGYEQRCQTVAAYSYQREVDGYDVAYRYHGRDYQTRLPYDPGARLAVNVNVSPAAY